MNSNYEVVMHDGKNGKRALKFVRNYSIWNDPPLLLSDLVDAGKRELGAETHELRVICSGEQYGHSAGGGYGVTIIAIKQPDRQED